MGKTTRPFRYDLNRIPYDYTVEVRNRFKGLDLIDRVPDEPRMEARDTVQETGIKTIPKKKKCKKAKWLPEEALQIAVKRRKAKSKGEMEKYTHLNAAGISYWAISRWSDSNWVRPKMPPNTLGCKVFTRPPKMEG